MKQLLLSLAVALISLPSIAQRASVVFFTEFGEPFTVFINGEKQNETPAPNVRIDDVQQDFFQIRVDFKDAPGDNFQANIGAEVGTLATYMIKRNKKGRFVARLQSATPLAGSATEDVASSPPPAPTRTPAPSPAVQTDPVVQEPAGSEQTTTISTTTTTTGRPEGEAVGIKMQVPGGGVTIDIDGMDMDMQVKETTTVTTTTTTTTRPSERLVVEEAPAPVAQRKPAVSGYGGRIGCDWPVDKPAIDQMKKSISSKSFEDSKMTLAKQATRGKCLTAEQVKEIMGLFTFEDSKLEYAKFAYDFTYDVDNYYIVNDAFTFESSIDDLNEFIEGK